MAKKAIFIDRDGTIIKEPADEQIDSLEKLEFVPGAISGLRSLMNHGYELVMVSNQDGLGTDSFPEDTFWPAHNRMLSTLEGEGVVFDDILIDRSFPETMPQPDDESFFDSKPEGCELVSNSWEEIARHILSTDRTATIERNTSETQISISIDLDGHQPSAIDSGLKFLDHMLWQLPHHAGISLGLKCHGDLEVDEHHTMEDIAIALGHAIDMALGSKRGIERYGFVLPMDECKAMVLIDFGGRADFMWDVEFSREYVGDTPTEMYSHFFKSMCVAMRCNLHISARGENNHHLIEAVFKAFARALRMAIRRDIFSYSLPSSKGIL